MKFVNQIHGKTAINELVAGNLADEMGLPCPETVLVDVPQIIIDGSEDLSSQFVKNRRFLVGKIVNSS